MINIMVVDDHEMVLEGMRNMLARISNVSLVATASNAIDAIAVLKCNQVQVAFVDINLPDISGIELCRKIKKEFASIHVIALSSFAQRSYVSQMIANGASGYLIKSAGKEEIEEAIEAVLKNKIYISKQIGAGYLSPVSDAIPTLTRREKEVLLYISQGLTNKDIAEKIFVSQSTVDSHRKNLLAKFNVQNTASLITIAVKLGVLT
ncbi:MAG: response regulator transcription factor [Bacteroidetes bacterium]|nr:response regulator transcription factor [Bacteroidota bacterium]